MWKKPDKPKPKTRSKLPQPAMKTTRHAGQWHAVSVAAETRCCEAARGLLGRRFLAAEAPRLPLRGCSMPEACDCKYKHHGDRRGLVRRKEDLSGLRRRDPGAQERRSLQPRRETDSE